MCLSPPRRQHTGDHLHDAVAAVFDCAAREGRLHETADAGVIRRIHLVEGMRERTAEALFGFRLAVALAAAGERIGAAPAGRSAGETLGILQNCADMIVARQIPETVARPMNGIFRPQAVQGRNAGNVFRLIGSRDCVRAHIGCNHDLEYNSRETGGRNEIHAVPNALYDWRVEERKLQTADGGTLTPAHAKYLQDRLAAIRAGEY
jgi:hypothetical protein